MTQIKTETLSQWFGSDRTIAASAAKLLNGRNWIGVPFGGGCSILRHLTARTILVGDLHGAMMNMARVAGDPKMGPQLYRRLRRLPFHPEVLKAAQRRCIDREGAISSPESGLFGEPAKVEFQDPVAWAEDYFVSVWAARGGNAGKETEFNGGMSYRWNANGGDSNTRFRSAGSDLPAWRKHVLHRCNFVTMDAFEFLTEALKRDSADCGLYVDAPWPDLGDGYKHKFPNDDQVRLAELLGKFWKTRVVIRFGDHPLIRRLYPESRWRWQLATTKNQGGNDVPEALIVNQLM